MCKHVVIELFPISADGSPARYRERSERDPTYAANTAALSADIAALPRDRADLIHDYAKDRLAAEQSRLDSIMSRGQGLLVAQAFLTALLSLGGTVAGHSAAFGGWRAILLIILTVYLVIQTVLLTISALRAIGGIGYPAIGSSDLRNIMGMPGGADDIVRQIASRTLLHYRTASILNSWRFLHLANAQKSLRNSAITFALLVLATFTFNLLVPAAPSATAIRLPPQGVVVQPAPPLKPAR